MRRRAEETLRAITEIVLSKVSGARQDLRSSAPRREQLLSLGEENYSAAKGDSVILRQRSAPDFALRSIAMSPRP
jgi:hypothetical protein